jgi:hypothetical protein
MCGRKRRKEIPMSVSYSGDRTFAFSRHVYVIKKKLWSLLGARCSVFDDHGQLLCFCKRKALKIKEDIRVYSDESMSSTLLTIRARSVFDLGATYDVTDPATGQVVGALRRKALKSILRDEWHVLGPGDREVGVILEDSSLLAVLRRVHDLVTLLSPQSYTISIGGQEVGTIRQNRNPFTLHYVMDLTRDTNEALDRRLAVAAAILLLNVEGRQ